MTRISLIDMQNAKEEMVTSSMMARYHLIEANHNQNLNSEISIFDIKNNKIAAALINSENNSSYASIVLNRHNTIKKSVDTYISRSAWGRPCRNMFRHLVSNDPELLIDVIQHGEIEDAILTYAVEILGDLKDPGVVMSILNPLLSSEHALVREGAVYGLAKHISKEYIRKVLSNRLAVEESRGVKAAIQEALAEFDGS